jgi:hypothetical protein
VPSIVTVTFLLSVETVTTWAESSGTVTDQTSAGPPCVTTGVGWTDGAVVVAEAEELTTAAGRVPVALGALEEAVCCTTGFDAVTGADDAVEVVDGDASAEVDDAAGVAGAAVVSGVAGAAGAGAVDDASVGAAAVLVTPADGAVGEPADWSPSPRAAVQPLR